MTSIPVIAMRIGGGLLAGAILASGAYSAADALSQHAVPTQLDSFPAAGIDRLRVEAEGDVTITVDPAATEVRVTASGRSGFAGTRADNAAQGGQLTVRHDCVRYFSGSCSADLAVTLPPGIAISATTPSGDTQVTGTQDPTGPTGASERFGPAPVSVHADNGSIRVESIAGPVSIESGSGDLHVNRIDGRVEAHTDQGEVTAGDLSGPASLSSQSGRVSAIGVAGDLTATSQFGDVLVEAGPDPVRLTIRTDFGQQTVTGATDPKAPHKVTITSNSGNVSYLAP